MTEQYRQHTYKDGRAAVDLCDEHHEAMHKDDHHLQCFQRAKTLSKGCVRCHCYFCGKEIFVGAADFCLNCYDRVQLASIEMGPLREDVQLIAPALIKSLRDALDRATETVNKLRKKQCLSTD